MLKHVSLMLCFFVSAISMANEEEITKLMDFIETSPCIYNRNGSEYSGKDALEHINKKYHYFKDEITSAEDFIRLSASKSTMSGKAYTVQCPNQTIISSEQWLLQALDDMRQKNKK